MATPEVHFRSALDTLRLAQAPDAPTVAPHVSSVQALTQEMLKSHVLMREEEGSEEQLRTIGERMGIIIRHRELIATSNLAQPHEDRVTAEDAECVKELYRRINLEKMAPGLLRHLLLTEAYAGNIAEAMAEHMPNRVHPRAIATMGLLRNIGLALKHCGGYLTKRLATVELWERLGIDPVYREYMLPTEVNIGPVTRAEYLQLNPAERQRAAEDACAKSYAVLTPEQKIVEMSGLLAKEKNGQLRTLDNILAELQPTSESREAYEAGTGRRSLWSIDDDAYDRLNPEFCRGWADNYRHMREDWQRDYALDLEEIRQRVGEAAPA